MTASHFDHTHVCRACGAIYDCDGEWVPGENADGFVKAVCYFYHLHGEDRCPTCQAKLDGPDPEELTRMMMHPKFGVIRKFSDTEWMVIFTGTSGRVYRGESLADAVREWTLQQ